MAPANQCISMFVEALLFRPGWRHLTSFLPYLSDQVIRENPASRGTEVSYLLLPRRDGATWLIESRIVLELHAAHPFRIRIYRDMMLDSTVVCRRALGCEWGWKVTDSLRGLKLRKQQEVF